MVWGRLKKDKNTIHNLQRTSFVYPTVAKRTLRQGAISVNRFHQTFDPSTIIGFCEPLSLDAPLLIEVADDRNVSHPRA